VSVTTSAVTTQLFESTLKLWGFEFKRDARKSHIFSIPPQYRKFNANGHKPSEFTVSKGRTVNSFQLQEVCNLVQVTEEEFWKGPELSLPQNTVQAVRNKVQQHAKEVEVQATAPQAEQPVVTEEPAPALAATLNSTRIAVIDYLAKQPDYLVHDSSGRATSMIQPVVSITPQGLSSILRAMDEDGQVVREIKGKRTYSILLNVDNPIVKRVLHDKKPVLQVPHRAKKQDQEVKPSTPILGEPEPVSVVPTLDLLDYSLLAEKVVDVFIARLTTRSVENSLRQEIDSLKERLGRVTEYAQGLRRQLEKFE